MAAIQADRAPAAVRACEINVLMTLPPNQSSMPGMAGQPKLINSRT